MVLVVEVQYEHELIPLDHYMSYRIIIDKANDTNEG